MLKAAEISSTLSLYHSAGFSSNNHYSKHWGNTTFNQTPVVSQRILIAADQNSTALLANRTDRPEVKTTAFSVWSVKKKLKQVSPTPSSLPSKIRGKSLLEYSADILQGLIHSLEQKAEPSAYMQVKILNSFTKDEMKPLQRKSLWKPTCPPTKYLYERPVV